MDFDELHSCHSLRFELTPFAEIKYGEMFVSQSGMEDLVENFNAPENFGARVYLRNNQVPPGTFVDSGTFYRIIVVNKNNGFPGQCSCK